MPTENNPRTSLIAITAIAFVLRIGLAFSSLSTHSAYWFFHEATELSQLAQSLVTTHSFASPFGGNTGPSAFLGPGYPLFIAAVFKLFGIESLTSARVILFAQSCFGATTVYILMYLAQRLFSRQAALIAGIIWAVSPPLVALPSIFWETSFSILLLITMLALTVSIHEKASALRWTAFAITSLIALFTNPSLSLAIAGCFLWLFFTATTAQQRRSTVLTAIACAAIFSVWPIRNLRVMHAFIPLRDNLGYELWQGNRPGSDGFFDPRFHPNNNPAEFEAFRTAGELGYMRGKGTLAKAAIRNNPTRFLGLTFKRIVCFWAGAGAHSLLLMVLYTSFTTALGLLGLVFYFRTNKKIAILLAIPLVLLPLPYYLTHPDYRFRCVLDPVLTILTAYVLTGAKRTNLERGT